MLGLSAVQSIELATNRTASGFNRAFMWGGNGKLEQISWSGSFGLIAWVDV
jgi:hypothetical protein